MERNMDICPHCNGRGILILSPDTASPCKCMVNIKVMNRFKNARMSSEMLKYSFNDFNARFYSKNLKDPINGKSYYENAAAAFAGAQKFVRNVNDNSASDGIVLIGPVGSGKTLLACSIANSLLEGGKEVLFVVVPDLLDQIRATYDHSNGYTEQDLIEAARGVGILILDDMGAHNYTEWTRNKLYSIINHRMNNRLPTVITTNLDLAELEEHVGERTTSRIIQMCKVYRLCVETDIRIVKRHEKDTR